MNNTESTIIQNLVKKLPYKIFFNEIPDRKQVINYIQWLYQNVPESKTVNQDKLIREVMAQEMRNTGMKIIDVYILILIGLDTITLADLSADNNDILKRIMASNMEKNDLDSMYRVLGQIMTKLPRDLKEQITGIQKLKIFQELSSIINMDSKLLEKFIALDPALNTPISMELDSGDYNTLKNKYSNELKKYEEKAPYLNSDSMEYMNLLQKKLNSIPSMPTDSNGNVIKAQYIDNTPTLMKGALDNKLYYYDQSSGVITEIQTNGNQVPITAQDLETILLANKVSKDEISQKIGQITGTTTSNTVMPSPSSTESSNYSIINSLKGYVFGSQPAPVPVSSVSPIITTTTTTTSAATTTTGASMESFTNNNNNNNKNNNSKITEAKLIENMKKNNSNIEKAALGFVLVLILMCLVVMYNAVRSGSK
jgi:hypothetical protein